MMSPKLGIFAAVSLFAVSSTFNVLLMYENVKIKRLFSDYIYLNSKSSDEDYKWNGKAVTESEVAAAREQGKVDGKIEAILMINKMDQNAESNNFEEILKFSEGLTCKELSADSRFISLLSQAAFHKGLHSGMESAKKDIEDEYTNGYHKAIEDFTCPETGKMSVPMDLKKPSK